MSQRSSQDNSERRPPRIVSACLAGVRCRYDGRAKTDERIVHMVRRGEAIPLCPEQLGGLPTPREAAPISSFDPLRVVTRSGEDVTDHFRAGAAEALRIAKLVGAREAILKDKSPSCGSCHVYRKTDQGEELISGEGVTTTLFRSHGIKVYNEDHLSESSTSSQDEST